jgi:hypothetical protein
MEPATRRDAPLTVPPADGATVSLRLATTAGGNRLVAFAREVPRDLFPFLSLDITDPTTIARWIDGLEAGRAFGVTAEGAGMTAAYAAPPQKGVVSPLAPRGFETGALLQDFVINTHGRTRDVLVMARGVPAAAPAVLTGGKP